MEEPFHNNNDLRTRTPEDLMDEETGSCSPRDIVLDASGRSSVSSGCGLNNYNSHLPIFRVTVTDPTRMGDGLNSYMVYSVSTVTECQEYKSRARQLQLDDGNQLGQFKVQRRYSDFLALYHELCQSYPGVFVPPLPEKHALGRFQEEFVETRRLALQKCLIKMTSHPKLYKDLQLINFLTEDHYSVPARKNVPVPQTLVAESEQSISAPPPSNRIFGVLKAVGEALSNFSSSGKSHETDEWFECKRLQVDAIEVQFRTLYKCVEAIAKHRKELGLLASEFGETLISASHIELNKSLSGTMAHIGEINQQAKSLHDQQAKHDSHYLLSIVDEFIRILGSIKMALSTRIKYGNIVALNHGNLLKAKENLQKARLSAAKNFATRNNSSTTTKLSALEEDVQICEKKLSESDINFKAISQTIREEMDRFDREKLLDFQATVKDYLSAMIETQKEIIHLWQSFSPTNHPAQDELSPEHH